MNTMFLATVIGWYMTISGLLILIKREQMKSIFSDIITQRGSFFIIALLAFIIGLLLVVSHNLWVKDWPVSITIFSWVLLIGSLFRLFFMDHAIKMARSFFKAPIRMTIAAIIFLIFGLYLLYYVYY